MLPSLGWYFSIRHVIETKFGGFGEAKKRIAMKFGLQRVTVEACDAKIAVINGM